MREKGRRLPWRDIQNARTYFGELGTRTVMQKGQAVRMADLREPNAPVKGPLLTLYEPTLWNVAALAFVIRGFERIDGPQGKCTVLQEWYRTPVRGRRAMSQAIIEMATSSPPPGLVNRGPRDRVR